MEKVEVIQVTEPDGLTYRIRVSVVSTADALQLMAVQIDEDAQCKAITVASWRATYEPATEYSEAEVRISDGQRVVVNECFQGRGLGSLLMQPVIRWIKSKPLADVIPVSLAGEDAPDSASLERRNRFYEKLGFKFDEPRCVSGKSRKMSSDELITPPYRLSRGCALESVEGQGQVFVDLAADHRNPR